MAKKTIQVGQVLKLNAKAPLNLRKMWGIGPFTVEQILDGGLTLQLRGLIPFLASRYQVARYMEDCSLRLIQPDAFPA